MWFQLGDLQRRCGGVVLFQKARPAADERSIQRPPADGSIPAESDSWKTKPKHLGKHRRNIASTRPTWFFTFFFPFFFLCVTECFFLFLNVSCATARGFTQFLTFFFFFFRKQLSFPTEFVDVLNFVTFLRILVLISSKIWLSLVSTLYYS